MNIPPLKVWTSICALSFLTMHENAQSQLLFESHDPLDVTIEAPLTTLMKVRSDVDYLDGKFSYTDESGELNSFDLKIRARGRFRRQKSTCAFPPVRLNFRTSELEGSLLEGQDKLKLIAHCNNRRAQNEQMILREYLAYRILQTLTDRSFSARLLRITYLNAEKDNKKLLKYGFVIEDDDSVADRTQFSALETEALRYDDLDAQQTNLINVFQYLIGNTDFSLIRGPEDDDCCHNSVPFSAGTGVIPVPYDFDFSGLVDAPYAEPNPRFKIRRVTVRHYRGRCSNNQRLPDTIAHVQSKKSEIMRLVDELDALDNRNRQKVTRFLTEFFDDISDDRALERNLIKECS